MLKTFQSMLHKVGDKIEVMLLNGGQSIYYYIISVEYGKLLLCFVVLIIFKVFNLRL